MSANDSTEILDEEVGQHGDRLTGMNTHNADNARLPAGQIFQRDTCHVL